MVYFLLRLIPEAYVSVDTMRTIRTDVNDSYTIIDTVPTLDRVNSV